MRRGAERRQGRAAGLDADPPVFRQIIIDKYPAARQYVRFLLQNNMTHASVTSAPRPLATIQYTTSNKTARCCQCTKRKTIHGIPKPISGNTYQYCEQNDILVK